MAQRKIFKRIYSKKTKKKRGLLLLKFFLGGMLVFVLSSLFLFFYYAQDLPRPEVFSERKLAQSTKIYDRTGKVLLYEIYGEEKRTWVGINIIPDYLKEAVISTEDENFYKHHFGIDLKAIVKAIINNIRIGRPLYGGSTIPQQLIRSTFLSTQKTIERKIREIVLTIELDRRYPKEQILEWYLNQIPFGPNIYGVEAASQFYFEKHVSDISLEEAATLAALIRAPSYLFPYGKNVNKLLERKNYVLERMVKEHYLSKEEAEKAKNKEIKFSKKNISIKAPYFTLWVKQQLEEKYGQDFLKERGLKVYTSLDYNLQEIAEEETKKGIERNKIYNAHNAALVAICPKTGEILAMTVGTGNYYDPPFPPGCTSGVNCLFDPKFNVVTGTKNNPGRQPGSAFKPFVYATAFKKGYDDKYIVIDEPTNFGIWGGKEYIPQNYDLKFRGPVTLRTALAQSLNIPSVKTLLDLAGLEDSIKTAQDLGITTLKPPFGPSIVLGGWEVKLLELTSAYGVFANHGLRIPPVSILKIEDSKGNIVFENKTTSKRVLDRKVADLITDILSDNEARTPMFGSNSFLYFKNRKVAAKTGTTQNYRDGWTIGYTPNIAVGVWVGNNDNTPINKKPGVTVAGPIFHYFLERALLIIH